MLRKLFSASLISITFFGCTQNSALSEADQKLLIYAEASYDKTEMMGKRVVIETRNGVPIVAEFPCGDICPDYTVRVIHYEVPSDQSCSDQSGVKRTLRVTRGRASNDETFCFPKVLSDNWEKYKK